MKLSKCPIIEVTVIIIIIVTTQDPGAEIGNVEDIPQTPVILMKRIINYTTFQDINLS